MNKTIAIAISAVGTLAITAGIAVSSWVILSTGNQTNESGLVQDGERMVTVTTHVRNYIGNGSTSDTTSDWVIISVDETEHINDSGNTISGHGQKHAVGDILSGPTIISTSYDVDQSGNSVIVNVYERTYVYEVGDNDLPSQNCVPYKEWWHKTRVEQQTQTIIIDRGDFEDIVSDYQVNVPVGSRLTPYTLEVPGASSYGFYKDPEYTSFFNFREPISQNTDLYAIAVKTSDDLSALINSGAEVTLYDSTTGGAAGSSTNPYNIFEDPKYDFTNKTVFLSKTTISASQTVSITYGNGEIFQSTDSGMISSEDYGANRGTDDSLALDYAKSGSSYNYVANSKSNTTISLFGDMTIKGTLNIGGRVGASNSSASGLQSFLFDSYATLDLCGHNLVIDGGTVNGFGLITDSAGTGSITVINSGTLLSTLTIGDARGRDQIILGYTKGQAPFTEYRFPYLQVPVKLMNGSTLRGSMKLDMGTFGIGVINLDVVGNAGNDHNDIFTWASSDPDQFVLFEPVWDDIPNLYPVDDPSAQGQNVIYRQMYYFRNRMEFFADINVPNAIVGQFSISTSLADLDASIDLVRVDVPISPFIDIVLKTGFTLSLSSKLVFYPGSSFYAETGSRVSFSYAGQVNYPTIGNAIFSLPGETRYISGGLLAYGVAFNKWNSYSISEARMGYGVYSNSSFWNEYPPARIVVQGSIDFASGNPDFYEISGPIDFSSASIAEIIKPASRVRTYALKAELTGGFCFHRDYHTTEESYEKAAHFSSLPLISLGKAYVVGGNNFMIGDFDLETGVFNSSGSNYILLCDTDLYADGSGSGDQGSAIDRSLSLTQVSVAGAGRFAKVGNVYYAYFSGIHVPVVSSLDDASASQTSQISANCRKFFSNSGLSSDMASAVGGSSNFAKYNSVELSYSSSFPHWRYKSFTA